MTVSKGWIATLCVAGSLAIAMGALPAFSQVPSAPIPFPTPTPTGQGARAQAMGSAFVAIADDATAASWNPAGLIQLQSPEFSIVGETTYRYEDLDSTFSNGPLARSTSGPAEGSKRFWNGQLNFASFAFPFTILDRFPAVASISYQQVFSVDRHLEFTLRSRPAILTGGAPFTFSQDISFRQEGGIGAFSPAFAVQLNPSLSLGLAVNFYTDEFYESKAFVTETISRGRGIFGLSLVTSEFAQREEWRNFEGMNFTIGALWNVSEHWTVGATVKTPFQAEVTRETSTSLIQRGPGLNFISSRPPSFIDEIEIKFPLITALGVAYRHDDHLTLSLDVTRTEQDDFQFKINDRADVPILSDPFRGADSPRLNFVTGGADKQAHIRPTHTVRLGAEYLFFDTEDATKQFVPVYALRAGLFYDPEPAQGHPNDFYGFSVGGGIAFKDRIAIDFAYIYRFGDNVEIAGLPQAEGDVRQHRFLVSTIIYF